MIVWLASFPRSGNTYYRLLLHHLHGVRTYSQYNDALFVEMGAQSTIGHERLPAPLAELDRESRLYFVKTHDLPVDRRPAIYLVRDGRDVMVSFARYNKTYAPDRRDRANNPQPVDAETFRTSLRRLITISKQFGGWSRNVLSWVASERGADPVVVRYEDLLRDPAGELDRSLGALGVSLTSTGGTVPSFEELHRRWPEFFRKGKTGSWREEMTDELHALFWQHHGDAMRALGYARERALQVRSSRFQVQGSE